MSVSALTRALAWVCLFFSINVVISCCSTDCERPHSRYRTELPTEYNWKYPTHAGYIPSALQPAGKCPRNWNASASEMTYTVSGGALNSTQTKPNPATASSPCGDTGPDVIHSSFVTSKSIPDHLSRFCRGAHGCDQQTHRHTDHTTSVTIGRILCFEQRRD